MTAKTSTPTAPAFKTRITTAGNVEGVRAWLEGNIKGQWTLSIDSVSDDLLHKNYALVFSDAADLGRFRAAYGAKAAAVPHPAGRAR